MNNHTYLAGNLPSSSLNTATTTTINPQLPPTTDNTFQFMPQSTTDQFTRISPATSLSKAPSMYQPQQHMAFASENSNKNMVSAFPVSQHITTGAPNQHTWDMIQQHYDLRLAESISTPSSSSSPLSSAVKQLNSPTSLGIPSATSTPPLYQELISLSTSSPTPTQTVDTSQHTSQLQHPPQSQMVHMDLSNRTEDTSNSQHEPIYWEQGNNTLDAFGDPKNNEQRLLQQHSSGAKLTEHQDQIIRQSRQLHEYSFPASGSSSFMPSDQQGNQNSTNPSKQQKRAPASASSNYHKTPDQQIRSDTSNSKRSHQDSLATTSKGPDTPQPKRPKNDTATTQQSKTSIPAPEPVSTISPPFTVASFDHMTREEMVERLVFLENERLDLQQQLEQRKPQGIKHPKTNNTSTVSNSEIATEDIHGKPNPKTGGGDDDDDDDDEVESISSGAEINPTSDDKTEMKCLWKNCGTIRVGVRDLTDHIVSAHVGGGKPLYRCEWENCRRSHKPFTKRHKICNHLRVHTGERPFVCDKPGCEKRFSRLDSLTTHIKTHSTVRPFICHITGCEKAYYHARSLKKHLKLHEDEKAKENEHANNTLDTSNSNLKPPPPPVAFTAAPTSSDPQSAQQQGQHHAYPFEEGMALPQFLLQPGSNITTASMRNEQMIDQSLINSAQSLFDPLAFQALSALPLQQQQQQQQQDPSQFMQLGDSLSQVTMPPPSTNNNINMMDTLQQQQQQRSNKGHQTGYNVTLPMVPGQPPMSQDGFCL